MTVDPVVVTVGLVVGGALIKLAMTQASHASDLKWIKDYLLKDAVLEFHHKKNPTPEHIDELIDKLLRNVPMAKHEVAELAEWLKMIRDTKEGKEQVKAEGALHLLEGAYL
jgi:hypothetical protein